MHLPFDRVSDDAVRRQRLVRDEKFGVLLGVDIVGDDRDLVALAQAAAKRKGQGCFARADGAADTDAQGLLMHRIVPNARS